MHSRQKLEILGEQKDGSKRAKKEKKENEGSIPFCGKDCKVKAKESDSSCHKKKCLCCKLYIMTNKSEKNNATLKLKYIFTAMSKDIRFGQREKAEMEGK